MLINLREWELGEKFLRNDWEHKESNQSTRKTQQIGAASSWQEQHQEAVSVSMCWSIAKPKITEGFTHFDGEHIAKLAFENLPRAFLARPVVHMPNPDQLSDHMEENRNCELIILLGTWLGPCQTQNI